MFKPKTMFEAFNFKEVEGNAMANNMAGWCGATMLTLSTVFMAAAQLDPMAQKKIHQYHMAGCCAFVYMSCLKAGKDLIDLKVAPLNGNVGTIMCTCFIIIGYLACYQGPDSKKKED
jgi:pyruvate/oxaloacetate carboxyltransferase